MTFFSFGGVTFFSFGGVTLFSFGGVTLFSLSGVTLLAVWCKSHLVRARDGKMMTMSIKKIYVLIMMECSSLDL